MDTAALERTLAAAKYKLSDPNSKVMVLGSVYMDDEVEQTGRVVHIGMEDLTPQKVPTIPAACTVILTTKFVKHKTLNKVRANLPKDALYVSCPLNTGQLRAFLKDALIPPKPTPSLVDTIAFAGSPAAPAKTELDEWIDTHTVAITDTPTEFAKKYSTGIVESLGDEARRLSKLSGEKFSYGTMYGVLYRMSGKRKEADEARKTQTKKEKKQAPEPARSLPSLQPTEVQEARKKVEELKTVLGVSLLECDLVLATIDKLQADNNLLQAQVARLEAAYRAKH